MILEIKKVRTCKNKADGNFQTLGREKARITISMEKNRFFSEYSKTLLHELLHAYTTMLRSDGFKVTDKKEHKWIAGCEDAIIEEMVKTFAMKSPTKKTGFLKI